MKIEKFNEKYKKFDSEYSDITEEYAKLIISEFIDKQDNVSTLESVYAKIIKIDDLDEDQAIMIKESLIDYLTRLQSDAENIRDIEEIEATKYNL